MKNQTDSPPGILSFRCNVCGQSGIVYLPALARESASCHGCGSTPRTRAVIRALSVVLFDENSPLVDFPIRKDLAGLGTTDSESYAPLLFQKFDYQNTYFHQVPFLDLGTADLPAELQNSRDFVISSEVFEHVPPPVHRAFENVWKLLKPGGVFILTVPYGKIAETIEHFPELHDFSVVEHGGVFELHNITKSGVKQSFKELVFHEGPGSTLEMRVFSESDLIRHLTKAGFENITIQATPDFSHGIWWPEPWSWPITARKPRISDGTVT
jgi:SAM-dependent methyltransferase